MLWVREVIQSWHLQGGRLCGEEVISLSMALHFSTFIGKWEITAKRLCDLYLDAKLATEE